MFRKLFEINHSARANASLIGLATISWRSCLFRQHVPCPNFQSRHPCHLASMSILNSPTCRLTLRGLHFSLGRS